MAKNAFAGDPSTAGTRGAARRLLPETRRKYARLLATRADLIEPEDRRRLIEALNRAEAEAQATDVVA